MKKKLLVVVLAVFMALVFVGCNSASFMSDGQRGRLVKQYGTPQAEIELKYTVNDKEVTLKLTYGLLLDKTPVSVVNFINLIGESYYNGTIIDSRMNSTTSAWIGGRYKYEKGETAADGKYSLAEEKKYSIIGEFVQNGYALPKEKADEDNEDITDGNAKFDLFSLAMYHDANAASFDSASTAIFFELSEETKENYKNYAVIGKLVKATVLVDGEEICKDASTVPASVISEFRDIMFNTTTFKVVVDKDASGNDITESRTLLKNIIQITSIKMSDGKDYSKLPKNFIIEK